MLLSADFRIIFDYMANYKISIFFYLRLPLSPIIFLMFAILKRYINYSRLLKHGCYQLC